MMVPVVTPPAAPSEDCNSARRQLRQQIEAGIQSMERTADCLVIGTGGNNSTLARDIEPTTYSTN